jgi:signal transduction histidine kinase
MEIKMGKFNNIPIRKKLVIIQTVTAFVSLLICCIIFVTVGVTIFKSAAERKMQSIAKIVGANSVSPLLFMDQDADSVILRKLSEETDIVDAIVFDKKNKPFASYYRPGVRLEGVQLRNGLQGGNDLVTSTFPGDIMLTQHKIFNEKDFLGTLVIRSEMADVKKILESYVLVGILVLLAGLISALVTSYLLQKTISNRLLLLVGKTRKIAETGNYSIRVSQEDNDEIGVLSKEFNALLEQTDKMERSLKESNADLEKRVAQRTVELEASNKELESFSYSVSHDLKAPLRAINGFTEILVKKYAANIDDKGKEIASIIVANAKKMGQLIEDLLEFSRIGRKELKMGDVSMNEIVRQVIDETKNSNKDRHIELDIEKLPDVHGDRNLLTQVWTNLISNAFKYTGHKGDARIKIGFFIKDDEYVFYIKDNGAGFDMKYQDKLFKVFQRLHGSDEFEGTGVGLANVNRIISKHKGRVWAEGQVGEGAIFYFSLPVYIPVAPQEGNIVNE